MRDWIRQYKRRLPGEISCSPLAFRRRSRRPRRGRRNSGGRRISENSGPTPGRTRNRALIFARRSGRRWTRLESDGRFGIGNPVLIIGTQKPKSRCPACGKRCLVQLRLKLPPGQWPGGTASRPCHPGTKKYAGWRGCDMGNMGGMGRMGRTGRGCGEVSLTGMGGGGQMEWCFGNV